MSSCVRLLNNFVGIFGNDILFDPIGGSGDGANIFTRDISYSDSRLFDINYRCHRPVWLLFFFMYIDGAPVITTPVNGLWRFRQSGCNPSRTPVPYDGSILSEEDFIYTNTAVSQVADCDGLTLCSRFKDPLDSGFIVRVNGVGRNLKIQYDAAMRKIKKGNTEEGVALFANLASLQNNLRDTASSAVKHIISVARVFSGATAATLRSANDGWLPETLVEMPQGVNGELVIYPNPASDAVQVSIKNSNYHLSVTNAIGQTIFDQNTDLSRDYREGSLSVNVANWTNGIYLSELTDKATKQRQRHKVVIQH